MTLIERMDELIKKLESNEQEFIKKLNEDFNKFEKEYNNKKDFQND